VVLVTREGAVAIVTLNRPTARNAMSPEMMCRMADLFDELAADARVKSIVLTGSGDRAFCSGGDLNLTLPLLTGARAPSTEWDRRLMEDATILDRSSLRMEDFNKPVIAAVNGACLAGGFEILLATDIRIVAEHAIFGLPEVRHGLIPFAGALVRLPRQIPYCTAMQLMLTGEPIDAPTALRLGLVNAVLPTAEVLPHAIALAQRIADNGAVAVQRLKRTVQKASGATLAEGFALEDESRRVVMATSDAREGPRAFIEKRAPRFIGR